ncbi:MAG: HPP family protein [Guyparkeria sp.]
MSFTVFGRGVSDGLTIDEATSPGLLRPPTFVEPPPAVREDQAGTPFARERESAARHDDSLRAYRETAGQVNREPSPVSVAEQIMSRPALTVRTNDTVGRARDLMAERRIGLLPVLGEDGRIEAIITRGDITRQRIRYSDLAKMPVGTVAHFEVLTAGPRTNIRELARVLLEQDIRGMPIVDQSEEPPRVVGVVTRSDILRALINYAPLELWL